MFVMTKFNGSVQKVPESRNIVSRWHKRKRKNYIGIKHDFSCINIRQVPSASVFNTSQGTWRIFMHWKTMFDRYYCIKTQPLLHFALFLALFLVSPFHRCLSNVISTDYARSRAGQYTSRNGSKSANLWPRNDHIESFVAVHQQRVNCLVNTRLFAVNATLITPGDNVRHFFLCNNDG